MAIANADKILDTIVKELFGAEDRRIGNIVKSLCERNYSDTGSAKYGFMLMGQRVLSPEYAAHHKALATTLLPTLAIELREEGRNLLREKKIIEDDMTMIRQAMAHLVMQVNDGEEFRNGMPECILDLFPDPKRPPRKHEDFMYLIRSNKYAVADVERAMPKIEFYLAVRLMY